jgi:hypothetical protein
VERKRKTSSRVLACSIAALLCGDACISSARAQGNSRGVKAVQILGLPAVKESTKRTLEVENTDLHFLHGKQNVDVNASSIESVSTGANSQVAGERRSAR